MKDELHRHLDGDTPRKSLTGGDREEALAWNRLLEAFRTEMPNTSPPPWLESRVMAEIEVLPEPSALRRIVQWMTAPRPVRISPLSAGLAAAVMGAVMVFGLQSGTVPESGATPETGTVVYVQFALDAPSAQSVSVSGDFNGWTASHSLEDMDGDGVWTARVPVQPGVHAYMFLVDGSTWMTDPRAQRYSEDGFGNRNAILAVAGPSA